jgi:hypothetical protein
VPDDPRGRTAREHGPATSGAWRPLIAVAGRKGSSMPQMFDWIFFAIMIPIPAFLVWDWFRNR